MSIPACAKCIESIYSAGCEVRRWTAELSAGHDSGYKAVRTDFYQLWSCDQTRSIRVMRFTGRNLRTLDKMMQRARRIAELTARGLPLPEAAAQADSEGLAGRGAL